MTTNGHSRLATATAPGAATPADALRARLDDPRTAAALHELLDRAEVLAFLVEGVDGFLRRGEVIADSLASAVGDLRGVQANSALAEAGPALRALLPAVTDPATLTALTRRVAAVGVAGRDGTPPPSGARALLRGLRDPDTLRGLGFLLRFANALGRGLRRSNPVKT